MITNVFGHRSATGHMCRSENKIVESFLPRNSSYTGLGGKNSYPLSHLTGPHHVCPKTTVSYCLRIGGSHFSTCRNHFYAYQCLHSPDIGVIWQGHTRNRACNRAVSSAEELTQMERKRETDKEWTQKHIHKQAQSSCEGSRYLHVGAGDYRSNPFLTATPSHSRANASRYTDFSVQY